MNNELLSKEKLREYISITTNNKIILEEESEDVLISLMDDFLDRAIFFSSALAKHRGSNVLEKQDIEMFWNQTQKTNSNDKISTTKPHRRRLDLKRKSDKK